MVSRHDIGVLRFDINMIVVCEQNIIIIIIISYSYSKTVECARYLL